MLITLLSAVAAIALQSGTHAPVAEDGAPISLDALPVEQSTALRCGVAFAVVSRWQKAGDERGASYPDMESEGGREFFVQAMADLMESQNLDRDQLMALVTTEVDALDTGDGAQRVEGMMPACLLLKESAGL